MKIKIYKTTLNDVVTIYLNDKARNFLIVNGENCYYNINRFKFKLQDMMTHWPAELVDYNIKDGLQYKIIIKKDSVENVTIFKNKFPEDIFLLENLIHDVLKELRNGQK